MAKKHDYEALEQQIGDLGGDPVVETQEEGLGKLQHKAAYGQREDLSSAEEKEMKAFLERQKKAREARENPEADEQPQSRVMDFSHSNVPETPIADGWVVLPRKAFGIRSQFYPEGWEFYIHAASTMAIKNWISVDEENAVQLNKVFDEILKLCVKVRNGEQTIPWSRINTWDRFWLILKVRELTFTNNKSSVTFEDDCSECDQTLTFTLTPDSLHYEFPDEDIVEKHWNAEEMKWIIDPTEYGVDADEINLYVPTVGVQQAIIDWAQRQINRKKKVDENFVSVFLPWMINKVSRDENQFDRQVAKLEKAYRAWPVDFHMLMTDIVKNVTINPQETLKQVCPHCGEEVVSNVQFPNGVKVLFEVETRVQKFGSRQ